MKRTFLLLVFFAATFSWMSAYAENEPNDTRAQANTLLQNSNDVGTIGSPTDVDWYKVSTYSDGKLIVTLAVTNGYYCWATLYDNNGTTVLGTEYTSGTQSFEVDGLAAGTYYIQIYPYYTTQLPTYKISDSLVVPTQPNDVEPNNTRAQALVLPLNGSKTGHVGYFYNNQRDTADWYQVTTTGDGKLALTLAVTNGKPTYVTLYDNNGTTLLNSVYTSGTTNMVTDGLAAGTYYVRVYNYYSSDFAPYTISNSLTEPTQINDVEPDSTRALAIKLNQNSSKTGHIGYYYNNHRDTVDWYKVTTNADGRLRITMASANGQNVWAYLFDNNGTTLLASGYTSGTSNVVNADGLAAGTYYIRVNNYYTSEFAPYTITDSLFSPTQANDIEPNDSKATAEVLTINGSTTGHVNYYYNNKRDTSDWYQVVVPTDGMLTINIASYDGQNVWAYLYDNDGTTVIDGHYTSGSTSYNVDGLQAGTYYVKINTYYSNEFVPYSFGVSLTTYTNTADAEPNKYFAQAKTVGANDTTTGHVNFYYNNSKDSVDVYKINYTGSGNLTLAFNQESWKINGTIPPVWFQVYKDTAAAPISNAYYYASGNINFTNLTKGYYYIKVFPYYSNQFSSYSFTNSFTQTDVAAISLVNATAVNSCDQTNSIKLQCSGSSAPYTVKLYRFGVLYNTTIVNNTSAFNITGLPTGYYFARVYGDGATGTAYSTSAAAALEPTPSGLTTSNIQATQAKLSWTGYAGCVLGYKLQYKEQTATTWITKYLFNTTATLKGLTAGTTYQWRVAAGDSANSYIALSPNSTTATFTTAAAFASAQSADGSSINAGIAGGNISIYPNPVKASFTIQFKASLPDAKVSASLKDMYGNTVWTSGNSSASAINGTKVDASKLANGLYLLQVTDLGSNTTVTKKVVVSK